MNLPLNLFSLSPNITDAANRSGGGPVSGATPHNNSGGGFALLLNGQLNQSVISPSAGLIRGVDGSAGASVEQLVESLRALIRDRDPALETKNLRQALEQLRDRLLPATGNALPGAPTGSAGRTLTLTVAGEARPVIQSGRASAQAHDSPALSGGGEEQLLQQLRQLGLDEETLTALHQALQNLPEARPLNAAAALPRDGGALPLNTGPSQAPDAGFNPSATGTDDWLELLGSSQHRQRAALVAPAGKAVVDQLTDSLSSQSRAEGKDSAVPVSTPIPDVGAVRTATAAGAQARPSPGALQLNQPMGQPEWQSDLGSRIVWMTKGNLDSAQIRLNPPNLGPLEVRVSVHNDSANVAFVAHHAAVRDAVEAALPRLREMMGEQGFNLADVDVSDHSATREGHAEGEPDSPGGGERDSLAQSDEDAEAGGQLSRSGEPVGMVDYFV